MIAWCYPIVFWSLAASLLVKFSQSCLADKGPRWLPLIGAGMAMIPLQGIPLGRWIHGVTGGFSIPLFVLMLSTLWSALTGRPLLSKSDRLTMCIAGAVIGVALYPLAIGLGTFDPYALGWSSKALSAVFVIVTGVLLWLENGVGYVLLFSAAAWQIGLLESTNAWDYVVDPVYSLSSLVVLIAHAFRMMVVGNRRSEHIESKTKVEPVLQKAA